MSFKVMKLEYMDENDGFTQLTLIKLICNNNPWKPEQPKPSLEIAEKSQL